MGSRGLDEEIAAARISAMEGYDEALRLFGDDALTSSWREELGRIVSDDQVTRRLRGELSKPIPTGLLVFCFSTTGCSLKRRNGNCAATTKVVRKGSTER
jgi:hypothetical protein